MSGTFPTVYMDLHRVLRSLPPVMHLAADDAFRSLLDVMTAELSDAYPGRQAMADRLLDLLLIRAIRSWVVHAEGRAPAWYRAYGDEILGPVLLALHHEPAQPWTAARLGAVSDVSAAALTHRFRRIIGEPPLGYLTCWRMTLAADMLRRSQATVSAAAQNVGYTDQFAFSTAFKRAHGKSPSDYRAAL